jgi:Flp pilus assembly protein CpaB
MVTSWFARLTLIFAIFAVFAFDGISVLAAHFSASDDAQTAAQAAAAAYQHNGLIGPAVVAAEAALPKGDKLVPGSVQVTNTGTVSLKVRRTARSLLLHMTSETKKWSVVTESGSADPPS